MSANIAAIREDLIGKLNKAAELEHSLACAYLFAAATLKTAVGEGGMNEAEAALAHKWKHQLHGVAIDEMDHLAQVNNLLTAIGGAPHFDRPSLPMHSWNTAIDMPIGLLPFGQDFLDNVVCFEMPEKGILSTEDEAKYTNILRTLHIGTRSISGISTVAALYRQIEAGIKEAEESQLFIGAIKLEGSPAGLDLKDDLVVVTDAATASKAIERIIEQGEAPKLKTGEGHFFQFAQMREAFIQAQAENAGFRPARAIATTAKVGQYKRQAAMAPETYAVSHIFDESYSLTLWLLERVFAHADDSPKRIAVYSRAALTMMRTVIGPLAEALCKMPINPGSELKAPGPAFDIAERLAYLPHGHIASRIVLERLEGLIDLIAQVNLEKTPDEVLQARNSLVALAGGYRV